ncbi:2-dehydropantoate 2-reductase N-terminal domain-containing protein [Herbiconiux sp. 11R-BC]|uniref:ketopantoate reductase family protein n=1 Tax=Herbiconiux sp. 11R-BC TaxID=3111637 RepID=UPI003C03C27D
MDDGRSARILVVGAGAVGGWFGSRLLAAGRDVTFLVRPGRADALARDGLRVATRDGVETFAGVRTVVAGEGGFGGATGAGDSDGDSDSDSDFDVVLLAVKGCALEAAMRDLEGFVGPATTIVPLLNGLRHLELLAGRFGDSRVVGGLCVVAAQLDDDGTVRLLAPGSSLSYGELDGSVTERIRMLDAGLQTGSPGVRARLSEHIRADLWAKWVFLASGGVLTTLVGGPVGEIVAAPGGVDTALAVIAECAAVSTAAGFPPQAKALENLRATLTEPGSAFTTSLYRDLVQGRRLEHEAIVGDLVARAGALDVPVPLLTAAYARLGLAAAARA